MTWTVWLSTAISLAGLGIAFARLNHQLRKDRRESREQVTESLEAAIGELNKKLDATIDELEAKLHRRIERLDQKRSDDANKLHARVSNLENRTFATLLDRLSHMEGELKGISNIVRVLQDRFMGRGE